MSFPLSSTGAGDYFSSATPRYRNPSSTYLFQYTCLKLQPSSLICIFTYPARFDVFCGSQGFFANPSSGLCFFSPPLQKVPCGLSSAPSLSFPPWVCSSYYRRLCTPSAGFASGVGAQGAHSMITHRGMEKGLMVWWLAGPEEWRTDSGFALGFVGGFFCEQETSFLLWTVPCWSNKQKRKHPVRNDRHAEGKYFFAEQIHFGGRKVSRRNRIVCKKKTADLETAGIRCLNALIETRTLSGKWWRPSQQTRISKSTS